MNGWMDRWIDERAIDERAIDDGLSMNECCCFLRRE